MESKRASSSPLPAASKKVRLEHCPPSYGEPMPLNLDCKIFLSHSGKDKEFVRDLYDALCRQYRGEKLVFFDERTLPKAEAIDMKNILGQARQCQLGVLVVTEHFLVETPNPLLELEAFEAGGVRLLPLFFGMSVEEFKKKSQTRSWEEQWKKWSTKQLGGRSNIEEVMEIWRKSLRHVTTFSGLEYKKIAFSQQQYICKIVNEVARIIPPILFGEEGVHGKDRLCEMVNNMYEKCAAKHCSFIEPTPIGVASTFVSPGLKKDHSGCPTLDLVGIYGFSGLGKTTLCKSLCDFYSSKFNGKVCYMDLGLLCFQKHADSSRQKNVVSWLDFQDISQVKNFFNEQLSSMEDPIFLAIDNILPNRECLLEADFFLSCEMPKGSRIFITSKIESILTNLVSEHSFNYCIQYMPTLKFGEARNIFVDSFPSLCKFGFSNLEDDVNGCVRMCTIYGEVYHPLMLKSLATSIRFDRSIKNLGLKNKLMKCRSEGSIPTKDAWERVYKMFDKSYALLTQRAQRVFLDLVLLQNATRSYHIVYEWIKMLRPHSHKEEMDELQDFCFLEKQSCYIKILDLLVDYGKYKIGQGVHPEYVVVDGAHWWDDSPRSARTVSVSRWGNGMKKSQSLDLRNVKGVEVLHIVDNAGLQEVLVSGATCARLRSLIVRVPLGTSLSWTCDGDGSSMPASDGGRLQWVEIRGDVCFRPSRIPMSPVPGNAFSGSLRTLAITSAPVATDLVSVLGAFRNVEFLKLWELPSVQSIDLTTCANLKKLFLCRMPNLELVSGLENSNLEHLSILYCNRLLALTIPADSEASYSIRECESLEKISFCAMPSHCAGAHSSGPRAGPRLSVRTCPAVSSLDGLSQLTGGFEIDVCWGGMWEGRFGDLLKLDDGVDYSICKAEIEQLKLVAGDCLAGLAGVTQMHLDNAQHVGLLISALFKAQPKDLQDLRISCKAGGDCGCDQNVPRFGPSPRFIAGLDDGVDFEYHCPQVKELASLALWQELTFLDLSGCTSVEVWPDFATMTSLKSLDLSFTSLKEWPVGVLRLPHLKHLAVQGCEQLPAEELMKVVTFELPLKRRMPYVCIECSLRDVRKDLEEGRRDRRSIADALYGVYPELKALFDQWSSWSGIEATVAKRVVEIMCCVACFGNVDEVEKRQDILMNMRQRLLRLWPELFTEAFCACLATVDAQYTAAFSNHLWFGDEADALLWFMTVSELKCGGGFLRPSWSGSRYTNQWRLPGRTPLLEDGERYHAG